MLGQKTREGPLNNNSSNACDTFDSSDNNFDAMRNSSSSLENNNSSSKDKSNYDFDGLPDNYFGCGLPDKMLMKAL